MHTKRLLLIFSLLSICLIICAQTSNHKPYDYMATKITNPTLGAAAFKYQELTTDNTELLPKSVYRQTRKIIKLFTKNGKFDEQLWTRFYELVSDEWYRFCNWSYEENSELEIIYAPNTLHVPRGYKVIYCNGCTFWKIIR